MPSPLPRTLTGGVRLDIINDMKMDIPKNSTPRLAGGITGTA